jgi:hypothetical protein
MSMRTRQRIYVIFAVTSAMAFVAAVSPWQVRDASPAAAAQPAPPAPRPGDRIHVERTLVQAMEEVVEPPVRRERPRVQPRRDAEAVPPPLTSRARRVIFGSGRHRPEPFPRAGLLEAPAR